jgi:hypothetical protein
MPSENKNGNSRETNVTENAFFAKLSVLSNNGERIEEQVKQICKAAHKIDKYIEMLRGTGLNYTADSMARSTAKIKLSQEVILQIIEEMNNSNRNRNRRNSHNNAKNTIRTSSTTSWISISVEPLIELSKMSSK